MKDYYQFLEEFDSYNEWNNIQKKKDNNLDFGHSARSGRTPFHLSEDTLTVPDDRVNSPSHYTSGKTEVIDIIEDAVKDAPSTIYGMLQAQVLKYMLRVWLKDNPIEDMKKARWYLNRLIEHYENPPTD